MRQTGARYTFRANRDAGRHGWLRLTPAYSVGLVRELVANLGPGDRVLDPFCGTGTTALACAEAGIDCDTIDINPFLVWLTQAKCASYAPCELDEATALIELAANAEPAETDWRPPIAKIERWWDEMTLAQLAAAWRVIRSSGAGERALDLATIAFCRAMMAVSKASYRHQSISFSNDISLPTHSVGQSLVEAGEAVAAGARQPLQEAPRAWLGDSRCLGRRSPGDRYSAVITSPPYPNRMSYVRELRPYLYWLGYLLDGRAAGELDWAAIGGTWGIATSRLAEWEGASVAVEFVDPAAIDAIRARSPLLANYVLKYIEDMAAHFNSLPGVMRPGGRLTYIIGNSRFYGVPIETHAIFAALLRRAGFQDTEIVTLRKRTSKIGLFEYAVTAVAPS